MNNLSNLDHKDVWLRALWTFAEAFVAVWALSGYLLSKVALISALAGGISAVKNYGLQVIKPVVK